MNAQVLQQWDGNGWRYRFAWELRSVQCGSPGPHLSVAKEVAKGDVDSKRQTEGFKIHSNASTQILLY